MAHHSPSAIPTVPFHHGHAGAIPVLGFGTWQATGDEGYQAVRDALDVGYRHLDTAHVYRNHVEVGRALTDSGIDRAEVFLTTKVPPRHTGRARETLEQSLTELGTDHVDLWLIHWSEDSPHVELWQEMLTARSEGLARAVGVSNFSTAQIDALIEQTGVAPALNQIRWGPPLYDPARAAALAEREVVLEGYSAFKVTDLDDPVLQRIAGGHGRTAAQVVLRWHIQHDVVVIPKSVTRERIVANLDVFGFTLTADEVAEIDALNPGNFWRPVSDR